MMCAAVGSFAVSVIAPLRLQGGLEREVNPQCCFERRCGRPSTTGEDRREGYVSISWSYSVSIVPACVSVLVWCARALKLEAFLLLLLLFSRNFDHPLFTESM